LTEHASKLDAQTKADVEKALSEARDIKDSDDIDMLKAKSSALSEASLKIGQAIYGKQSADASSEEEKKGGDDDNTVEADFKEKK
jgi:molecular chaperone DnaK